MRIINLSVFLELDIEETGNSICVHIENIKNVWVKLKNVAFCYIFKSFFEKNILLKI